MLVGLLQTSVVEGDNRCGDWSQQGYRAVQDQSRGQAVVDAKGLVGSKWL